MLEDCTGAEWPGKFLFDERRFLGARTPAGVIRNPAVPRRLEASAPGRSFE